ncbi:MAG: hypothetical protein C0193_00365 [Candidatus Bathyarchaeota archaeon]|nr:MAG: hypothetical protein C0193_00365 [Candidatus Bathyarchaeota archaeon]
MKDEETKEDPKGLLRILGLWISAMRIRNYSIWAGRHFIREQIEKEKQKRNKTQLERERDMAP